MSEKAVLCIPDDVLDGMIEHLEAVNKNRREDRRGGDGLGAYLGTGIPDLPGVELRTMTLECALRELKLLREFNNEVNDERNA